MGCLDRETAMSYLRGDLEPDESERWSAHLAKCEGCRQQLEEVSALVDDVRQELMFGDVPAESDWPRLERLIERRTGIGSAGSRLAWLRPKTFAVAAASLTVVVALFWGRADSVSAAEILERATLSERALVLQPGKVVHRVLTLEERRGASRTLVSRRRIEGWRKSGTTVSAKRSFDEAGRLVAAEWIDATGARTLRAAHRPGLEQAPKTPSISELLLAGEAWQVELSASTFSGLLPSLTRAKVTQAADVISIHYESGEQHAPIAAATLVLSANDLRAIEQTVQLGRGEERREYRFAEDRVAFLAADAIPAGVFEPEISPTVAPPAVLNAGQLLALEVEALRLLNAAGALLGEQVNVSRGSGQVRVQVMVDSEDRKQELERAVRPLTGERGVAIDIQTFAAAAQRAREGSSQPPIVRQIEIGKDEIPLGPQLRRHFGTLNDQLTDAELDQQVRGFANQASERSRLIVQHTWAMKRLASHYTPQELSTLPPRALRTWRAMLREHAAVVAEEGQELRSALHPIFFSTKSTSVPAANDRVSVARLGVSIERLLELAHMQDEAVRTAFSVSSTPREATFVQTDSFWEALTEIVTLARLITSD